MTAFLINAFFFRSNKNHTHGKLIKNDIKMMLNKA